MKKLRVYLDTSVIGGCFDEEFKEASLALMDFIRVGLYTGLISTITTEELRPAPEHVRAVLAELNQEQLTYLPDSDEVADLAAAYMKEEIVTPTYRNDATHVAFATVHDADVIVSWNFRHIVNLKKIEAFNSVNIREGYRWIEIRTPKELIYGIEKQEGL